MKRLLIFLTILWVMIPTYAGVPDWVKDIGIYIKSVDYDIEGYAVMYDLSSENAIYAETKPDGEVMNKLELDLYGCTTLIFTDDKVYIWGLVNRPDCDAWISADLSDDGKTIVLDPSTRIYYAKENYNIETSTYVEQIGVSSPDDSQNEKFKRYSEEPIVLRFDDDHSLVYERPASVDTGETFSFGYFNHVDPHTELHTSPYREECYYCVYTDPRLVLRDPQMLPKIDWMWGPAQMRESLTDNHYSGVKSVRFAYDGDIFYLLIPGDGYKILTGKIEGDKVIFKGNQSVNLGFGKVETPYYEYKMKRDSVCNLKVENWADETRLPLDKDIIFKYYDTDGWGNKEHSLEFYCEDEYVYLNWDGYSFMAPRITGIYDFPSGTQSVRPDYNLNILENTLHLEIPARIQIYTTDGRSVVDTFSRQYEISSLPHGVYIIRVAGRILKIAI